MSRPKNKVATPVPDMKDDKMYMLNPLTNRRILIGGDKYFQLLRDGILNDKEMPVVKKQERVQKVSGDKLRAECEDNDHAKEIKKQLQQEHPLPDDKTYVVLGNNIYIRKKNSKKLTRQMLTEELSKSALQTTRQLIKNPEMLKRLENNDETLLRDVRVLLNQNMLNKNNTLEDIQENNILLTKKSKQKGNGSTKTSSAKIAESQIDNDTKKVVRARTTKKIYSDSERSVYDTTDDSDIHTPIRKNTTGKRNIPAKKIESPEQSSSESSSESSSGDEW